MVEKEPKSELLQYLNVVEEIMQRFAVVWDQIVFEDDDDFHAQFKYVKNANKLVITRNVNNCLNTR